MQDRHVHSVSQERNQTGRDVVTQLIKNKNLDRTQVRPCICEHVMFIEMFIENVFSKLFKDAKGFLNFVFTALQERLPYLQFAERVSDSPPIM